MRTLQQRRIGRAEAERLLSGGPSDPDRHRLAGLLAAAAAPGRPDELGGEAAMVAAFRARRDREDTVALRPSSVRSAVLRPTAPLPPTTTGPRRSLRSRAARLATVKVSCGLAVAALVGGTAYAAETGRLPEPIQQRIHDMFPGWDIPAGPEPDGEVGTGSSATRGGPSGNRPSATPSSEASHRAMVGLCRVWDTARRDKHARDLSPEEFRVLATAAGGSSNVAAFCTKLLAESALDPAEAAPSGSESAEDDGPGNGKGNGKGEGNGKGNGRGKGTPPPRPNG